MQNPVIVIGMARSGTTLLAEMLHKGGTPMFAAGMNPSYDEGNKFERVSCQRINLEILGVESVPAISAIWTRPLHDISKASLVYLATEVGNGVWGFKDPRTTITYQIWRKYFPEGTTIYTYRHHNEVIQHYFKTAKNYIAALRRTRRAFRAWIFYNEQLMRNFYMDSQASRRTVLVNYEELMIHDTLVQKMQGAIGISLHDARNLNLRRNKKGDEIKSCEALAYRVAVLGYESRLQEIYRELNANRVKPDSR